MYGSVMVKLPGERGAQLKDFAGREGLSVTEAIGALLRAVGAANTVPGFTVEKTRHTLSTNPPMVISFDGFTFPVNALDLGNIAILLQVMIDSPGMQGKAFRAPMRELLIARGRGNNSLVFLGIDKATGEQTRRVLTLDLCRDLARQMKTAIGA